ncbi:MAG: dephospho-CoA kinase [Flavobacteriales bacterium]
MKPLKVGITGGIGSGKSLVCRLFLRLGIPVYNADERAKQLTATNQEIRKQIVQLLGEEALNDSGLNREFVARKVFKNKELLAALNSIIHPALVKGFETWCRQQKSSVVIKESAILFETGSYKQLDKTILVTAPEEVRINRVIERDGLTKAEVTERVQNQWTDEQKLPVADFVLVNDGESLLLPQVIQLYNKLKSLSK